MHRYSWPCCSTHPTAGARYTRGNRHQPAGQVLSCPSPCCYSTYNITCPSDEPCCLQTHTHLAQLLQVRACWPGPPWLSSPALASAAVHQAGLQEQQRIAQQNAISVYTTNHVWTKSPTPAQAIGNSISYVQTRNPTPAQASGSLSSRPASEAEKQHTSVQRHAMHTLCSAIACTASKQWECSAAAGSSCCYRSNTL
jgi:hypothetical protein